MKRLPGLVLLTVLTVHTAMVWGEMPNPQNPAAQPEEVVEQSVGAPPDDSMGGVSQVPEASPVITSGQGDSAEEPVAQTEGASAPFAMSSGISSEPGTGIQETGKGEYQGVATATDATPVQDLKNWQDRVSGALQLLGEARTAAWAGRLQEAETAYRRLINEQPEDFDAYGELGNLYYIQGRWREAADEYAQAAALLVAAGYKKDAVQMMNVVIRLDRTLGQQLATGSSATNR